MDQKQIENFVDKEKTPQHDLLQISPINKQIFISGIYPLDDPSSIKKFSIKYILCCLDKKFISDLHQKILVANPDLTIIYLPLDDDINQNLWTPNKNDIDIIKFIKDTKDYDSLGKLMSVYQNKPLIEIGYHFINHVIESGDKILIHCMAGMSRSVSMVVYYLMKKYNLTFDQALDIIKKNRSIANPNDSFKKQLIKYQSKRDKFSKNDAVNVIDKFNKNI